MGYDNRMWAKDTANWGVQIAGMIFQTCSSPAARKSAIKASTEKALKVHNVTALPDRAF